MIGVCPICNVVREGSRYCNAGHPMRRRREATRDEARAYNRRDAARRYARRLVATEAEQDRLHRRGELGGRLAEAVALGVVSTRDAQGIEAATAAREEARRARAAEDEAERKARAAREAAEWRHLLAWGRALEAAGSPLDFPPASEWTPDGEDTP